MVGFFVIDFMSFTGLLYIRRRREACRRGGCSNCRSDTACDRKRLCASAGELLFFGEAGSESVAGARGRDGEGRRNRR